MLLRSNFSSFPQYCQNVSNLGVRLHIHSVKGGCSINCFPESANLICRSTDISNCFIESLGVRDNESRLYFLIILHYHIVLDNHIVLEVRILLDYHSVLYYHILLDYPSVLDYQIHLIIILCLIIVLSLIIIVYLIIIVNLTIIVYLTSYCT